MTVAGFIAYRVEPGAVALVHTDVDPAFEGRGLGSRLVAGALDDLRARGLNVVPVCPFVAAYIRRHPEYADLVVPDPARTALRMAATPDDRTLGKPYTGPAITVFYDRSRCRHYAECVHGLPDVFDVSRRPWIRADLADAEIVSEVVRRCPTGSLHYRLAAGDPEQPTAPTTIRPDPAGPLLVRGDLVVDTPRGTLHETRAALCGCGSTKLDPFCDGACGVNEHRPAGTRNDAQGTNEVPVRQVNLHQPAEEVTGEGRSPSQ